MSNSLKKASLFTRRGPQRAQYTSPLICRTSAPSFIQFSVFILQHIKSTSQGGVHYFVNGAANDRDDRLDHLDGIMKSTKYFWTNHFDKTTGAFAYCDVRKDQMSVTFVHSDQTVLYTTNIFPRSHPCNKDPDEEIVVKAFKAPAKSRPKPKKQSTAGGLPVFQKFRPKTKTELEKDDLKRQQLQQKQLQQQYKRRQQRLLEQQQLQAQRNANKMIYRYRGP